MNYQAKKVPVKIKNFEEVIKLTIEVISGDEILQVLYKDYNIEEYDSCYLLDDYRVMDFQDNLYTIYDITRNIDYIKTWSKRKDSYNYKLKEE
jgi:hypothetical protein